MAVSPVVHRFSPNVKIVITYICSCIRDTNINLTEII